MYKDKRKIYLLVYRDLKENRKEINKRAEIMVNKLYEKGYSVENVKFLDESTTLQSLGVLLISIQEIGCIGIDSVLLDTEEGRIIFSIMRCFDIPTVILY